MDPNLTDSEILDLIAESRWFKTRSDEFRRRATARQKVVIEMVRHTHEDRARAGNESSIKILRNPRHLRATALEVCSKDPIWKALIDDQQFNERLANQAAQQLHAELELRRQLRSGYSLDVL